MVKLFNNKEHVGTICLVNLDLPTAVMLWARGRKELWTASSSFQQQDQTPVLVGLGF